MTTTNDAPGDKLKESTYSRDKENIPPPDLKPVAKEEEPHPTHSFEWCWSHKKQFTTSTCDQAQTVEDCLKKSSQFREAAKKQKDKELVIVKKGRAISSHFPCSLIKNERLTLKFVKAVDNPKKPLNGSGYACRKRLSSKLVMFHVLARGGKNVVKILKNPVLRKDIQEITVYACKGEKVKQALRRDGRFLNIIFKKNCVLSHTSTEVNTEMCNLVDDLDGKTFKIKLLNKLNPPDSQPGSLDDACMLQSESQTGDSGGNEELSQPSTTAQSENDNAPERKPDLCRNVAPEKILHELPCSKKMQNRLSSKFKDLVKGSKTQASELSSNQNLLRLEFGSNAQICREVKTMKKLMELSNSVCQVRINGKPRGSGFLLFDKFVLTNAHVIKDFYNDNNCRLNEKVTVAFSYESLDPNDGQVDVEKVVGYDYHPEVSGTDWALLQLIADQTLPKGLLTHCGFVSHSGGICIIGHPDGGVKKIDPCLIVSSENRSQVVQRHYSDNQEPVQFVTRSFFEVVAQSVQQLKHVLTYKSGFYFGSSGSPVFNEDGNVVAMHSGGYAYPGERGQTHSVIEFGYPFTNIIECIIIQLVEKKRFDVLKEYLACSWTQKEDILVGVKKLVESRNLTTFKNVVNNSLAVHDESLTPFFEFFSLKEEPEPMETD